MQTPKVGVAKALRNALQKALRLHHAFHFIDEKIRFANALKIFPGCCRRCRNRIGLVDNRRAISRNRNHSTRRQEPVLVAHCRVGNLGGEAGVGKCTDVLFYYLDKNDVFQKHGFCNAALSGFGHSNHGRKMECADATKMNFKWRCLLRLFTSGKYIYPSRKNFLVILISNYWNCSEDSHFAFAVAGLQKAAGFFCGIVLVQCRPCAKKTHVFGITWVEL